MKYNGKQFLAVVFALLLGFSQAPAQASAYEPSLFNDSGNIWAQLDELEQSVDRDMMAQRQFFDNWMEHSLVTPDPFARVWQDQFKSFENMQTALNEDAQTTWPGSELKLSSGNGSRMQLRSWSNGKNSDADVEYAVSNQTLDGDVTTNERSELKLVLKNKTFFKGAFNADQKAKAASLYLDKNSVWDVSGTSYVTSLIDEDTSLQNIHSNGHTVYYDAQQDDNAWLKGEIRNLPGGGQLKPVVQTDTKKSGTEKTTAVVAK